MKVYQTVTKEADVELDQLLGKENRIYKPRQLNEMNINPIRLSTTSDELALYLYESAYIRPEFKVEGNVVQIPCFFAKVEGHIEQYISAARDYSAKHNKLIVISSGYHMLERRGLLMGLDKNIFVDGKLNVNMAMDNSKLSFLKPEKRLNYLNAINRILEWIDMGIVDKPENSETKEELVEIFLNNNQKIVEMFHEYDYQETPPKYIINVMQRRKPNVLAVYRMLLMHALGFDVIIVSDKGYSGVENYLKPVYYDSHNVRKNADIMPEGNIKTVGYRNIIFWVATVIALLLILKKIF